MTIPCLSCGGEMRLNRRYSSKTLEVYICTTAECRRQETAPRGYHDGIDPEYVPDPILCACGCGTVVEGRPGGRPQKWVNDAHRKRASRRGPP